jgi:hypothetical protein
LHLIAGSIAATPVAFEKLTHRKTFFRDPIIPDAVGRRRKLGAATRQFIAGVERAGIG